MTQEWKKNEFIEWHSFVFITSFDVFKGLFYHVLIRVKKTIYYDNYYNGNLNFFFKNNVLHKDIIVDLLNFLKFDERL